MIARKHITWKRLVIVVAALGASGVLVHAQTQEAKVALVIGNDKYEEIADLDNAVYDAKAIGARLRELGFDVRLDTDVNQRDIYRMLSEFEHDLRRSDVGLVYYSGHGMQGADRRNYLIPTDAYVEHESDIRSEMVPVADIVGIMEAAGASVNILILDACRNNPLPRAVRSVASRGLNPEYGPRGLDSAILFAAAPGEVASDGPKGGHGVFTGELLKALEEPGLTVEGVFRRTANGVLERTSGGQRPWSNISLTKEVYLNSTGRSSHMASSPIPSAVGVLLMPHSPHAGTIEQSGGTDVYRIEVTSDKPIVVISSTGPLDTKGWISRGPEKAVSLPIVQDDDSGVGFNFRLEAELDPGTYYIGVTSRDPGEYFVHFDTYRVVDLEQQVSATIDTPDDVHYFIASVPEESSLRLETHGAIHTDVSLLRKTGESSLTRVPIDEDSGAYEALTPGKYYIRVTGSDKGRYDLHLSRYIILSSSIKKITRGYTGVDLFQVNVTNDRPYITVYTTGALDTEGFVRVGPVIVPDDGMHVAGGGDDDSGHHSNFRISTHLEGGKYLIEVRWRSKAETAEYSIYFTAHRTPKDLHGNHRYEATRIASVGRSDFAGSISPDDRDVFSLELKQPAVLQAYSDSDAIEVVREDPEGLTHPNFGAPLVIGTGVHNFWAEDSFESGNDWYRLSFQVDPLEMLVSSSEGWMVHDFDADYFLFTVTDDFPAVRIYTTGEGAPYICVYTLLDDGTIEEDTSSQCGNSVGVLLESGRYIAVLSTSVAVGAYTVHIVAEPHETFGSSQATAIDLGGLGYAARGWLYGTDDVDWYLFEVQPEIPWISMQIDADRHVDVTAQLIGPDASGGDPVIASWNGGERFGLQVPPGRYLVAVRGVGGGEYSIDLDSGSVPVPLQSGAQSVLAPESTDVYSLGIAKRTLLELSGTVENARIELWHPRADGHVRVSSYNGDFRAMRILDAGSYLITATTDGVGLYSFALNMLEMSSDDYGWDPLQAVQLDGTLEGTLLPWDLDTFRIDVSEDQSLISIRHNSTDDVFVFLLKTATITTPSWKQGILENYELIATDIWNANLSRRLDAGTYYVAIASVDTAVDYSVHAAVSDVPRDHHGGDPTDATPLTSTHMGWIQSDDLDYFRFVVTDAESWVKIRITDNLTDDTIDNVGRFTVGQLIRHEEGEEALFMGQDLHPYPTRDVDLYAIYGLPGVEDLGISKLLESGTYYVKIQSIATAARHDALFHIGNSEFLETWPIDIGSYAIDLTIEDVPEDDHADELHGATVLTDVTKGWIGGDHIDYFRFVVPDSQPAAMIHIVGALQVKVTILKRTEDDDPVEITSAEGTPADGTSVGMELEPGTYYVRVETFAPRAAGPYKIHLHPVRGDGTTTGG